MQDFSFSIRETSLFNLLNKPIDMRDSLNSSFKLRAKQLIARLNLIRLGPHLAAVRRHKAKLKISKSNFYGYPHVMFVFQFFNKASYVSSVLYPFLMRRCQNLVLFADGCVDNTAIIAHSLLSGPNHFVICGNDRHEIANYRLSLDMARSLGCHYVVLLQDDDLYDENFFLWLDECTGHMKPNLIAITGISGCNIDPEFSYQRADSGLQTARFCLNNSTTKEFWTLGKYQQMICLKPLRLSPESLPSIYAATVCRSPQIIDVNIALSLGFFPRELEPYQYDDDFNAFLAWTSGYKVLFCPCPGKRSIGISGMRLHNHVSAESRPFHFIRNWNFILDRFSEDISSGRISSLVDSANRQLFGDIMR